MIKSQRRNWLGIGLFHPPKKRGRKTPNGCRLGFEPLEERRLLSLTVPTLNSLVGAAQTLYLDFDGAPAFDWVTDSEGGTRRVHGPFGNDVPVPAFSLDGNINDFTGDELVAINEI